MSKTGTGKTNRRSFLGKMAGMALATALPAPTQNPSGQPSATPNRSAAVSRRKRPPSVLFLMSDDMRTELACYGSRFNVHSPNIDALASRGVRFDRNYCQFPLCGPSRSSLFSGHIPRETGVLGNGGAGVTSTHPDWVTLPRLFRDSGYTTFRSGKLFHPSQDDRSAWMDFEDNERPSPNPADAALRAKNQRGTKMEIPRAQIPMPDGVLPPLPVDSQQAAYSDEIVVLEGNGEGHGDYAAVDRAIRMLNQAAAMDKPFFVGCGVVKPHSPPTAPQKFFDMYDPAKMQLTPDFAAWPAVPKGWPRASIRPRNADLFIGRGASEDEARQVIRAYVASISWADWNLGRVIAELDRLKLRDKTIIVFVTDHGYQLGENGKWSKAGSLFEGGTRVPLIIDAPGMLGNGRACTRMVQSLDIYRTLCELAGLEPPSHVTGTSLVPLLQDPRGPKWDQPAYSIWSEDGRTIHGTAVRTEKWRYAEYGKDAANGALLFDVHADPMELNNLASDASHSVVRTELSKLVNAYSYPA